MNLVPSVTTVMKIAAKPGLEAWKQEQMLLAALTLPRLPGETEKDLIARIVADSKETGKRAAERGTRVHESIEAWFEGVRPVEHEEIAKAFEESVFNHFKTHPFQPWKTETAFASELGYGGKVDLWCAPDEAAPTGIVLDAKSKEFTEDDDVAAYDEHLMQLAAYRHGLGVPHARCANVFASVTVPGLIKIVEWSEEDLKKGWEMFKCLLQFWKLKNNFGL
jgi:GAF domain-containing protein